MAKNIVEYLLEADGTTPMWIESGGYFPNENYQLVGLTVDSDIRNVPYGLTVLTKADILTRAGLNRKKGPHQPDMTNEEVASYVDAALSQMGVPDYV